MQPEYEDLFEPQDEIESTALVTTTPAEIIASGAPQVIAPDQLPDLDQMDEGIALQAKYLEFKNEGESSRGIFLGFTSMKNQGGKIIPVANWQNKDGVLVNAGANLVNQLHNVPTGTPVQITYVKTEKTKSNNNVKVFEVRLLQPKKTPAPVAVNFTGKGVTVQSKQLAKANTPKWAEVVRSAVAAGYIPDMSAPRVDELLRVVKDAGIDEITDVTLKATRRALIDHYDPEAAMQAA